MGTNLKDVYFCNLGRVEELNNRISNRNMSTSTLETMIDFRPNRTRQILFPMLNCNKPNTVNKIKYEKYNMNNTFNPGYRGPISGYDVNKEMLLRGAVNPLQRCIQHKYIPGTNSDLYNNDYLIPLRPKLNKGGYDPYHLIDNVHNFNMHNPNKCNLGNNLFNNHIRQQIKSLGD